MRHRASSNDLALALYSRLGNGSALDSIPTYLTAKRRHASIVGVYRTMTGLSNIPGQAIDMALDFRREAVVIRFDFMICQSTN